MKIKSLKLLLVACIFTGCVTPDKAMKSFIGQPSSVLIGQWGPPQSKAPDGQGGEVWIYQEGRSYTTPGNASTTATAYGQSTGTATYNPYGSPYGNGSTNYSGQSAVVGQANTTYTPPQTHSYTAIRSFYINSSGIIYNYRWKGL